MPNRTAKFVSAVFASLVAGAPLTTTSHGATPAADDCLAGPTEQTPQGGHWYYHIEHPSNRHCWYLRDEHDKLAQTAPPNASVSAEPVAPNTETAMQRSIANAHAELLAPQTPAGQDIGAAIGQTARATAVNAPGTDNSRPANAADPNLRRSVVASRWPDPSSGSSSAGAGPMTANPDAAPSNSAAALPPAIAAVPLATADTLPEDAEKPSGTIRMVLLAVIGALSVAGLMGRAIFRLGGGTRRIDRRDIRSHRRAIWDSAGTDRRSPPAYLDARMWGADIPPASRAADDPNRRVAEMLARLSRSSTA